MPLVLPQGYITFKVYSWYESLPQYPLQIFQIIQVSWEGCLKFNLEGGKFDLDLMALNLIYNIEDEGKRDLELFWAKW